MACKFIKNRRTKEDKILTYEILKGEYFRYLGSITNKNGESADDVTHRINVG